MMWRTIISKKPSLCPMSEPTKGKIIYIPVYYIMFFQNGLEDSEAMQF